MNHGFSFAPIQDAEDAAAKVAGEPQYFALGTMCFTRKADGFEYSVCPFKDAKQDHTSLGKFDK